MMGDARYIAHDDVIKWKHFPRYWPFARGIHRSPVIPRTKASDAQLFDVFFDLRLNKRLSKQSWGWWFGTLSHPLWRHCNAQWRRGSSIIFGILLQSSVVRTWSTIARVCTEHWWRSNIAHDINQALIRWIPLSTHWGNTMKMFEFRFKFYWSLFLRVHLTIF